MSDAESHKQEWARRNMYCCLPCPKCKSDYRVCYGEEQVCDDCGFKEPIDDFQRREFRK